MSKIRSTVSKRNKFYISKNRFLMLYYYCLQYKDWQQEYINLHGIRTINTDGLSGSRGSGNPTAAAGERAAELSDKMDVIEDTAKEAAPEIWMYILLAVTTEGMTFDKLKGKGLPCERKMYYNCRRRFYWLLDKKLS